jgi:hypothetical protein
MMNDVMMNDDDIVSLWVQKEWFDSYTGTAAVCDRPRFTFFVAAANKKKIRKTKLHSQQF